jgi:hypothetical protein
MQAGVIASKPHVSNNGALQVEDQSYTTLVDMCMSTLVDIHGRRVCLRGAVPGGQSLAGE